MVPIVVAQGLYDQGKTSDGLTRRQRQVLEGLKAKKSQLEIATELGISRQRVRQIVEDLLRKGQKVPGSVKPPPE